jgi:tRNA(Arg) A34 adenosine deaminase TadA
MTSRPKSRRLLMAQAVAGTAVLCTGGSAVLARPEHPDPRWQQAAQRMLKLAESWGDQSYGAVLVLGGKLVGEGPSRVVKDNNLDAHAERVAIADAQQRLGRKNLAGSVLYSTSRPCAICEAAASCAGVSLMYFGAALQKAVPNQSLCVSR